MDRNLTELRPVCITGDLVVCEECLKSPTPNDGKMLVIASFSSGKLTDFKCAECRGHIKDAQLIIEELANG